jgi:predicted DsbA family dithiol-disulfide isomerase
VIVEVWSDIVCPWCYIGKRRFEGALERFEHRDAVEIVWRSFELDPRAPRTLGIGLNEMLAGKYGVSPAQAAAMNARVSEQARGEGLDYRLEVARPGNTFDAHRLTHLAATTGNRAAAVERFMHAYFVEGAEIGDPETLVRLAAEVGVDADAARRALAGDAFAAEVRADEARARALGVSGVPFFAIDERYGVSGAQPVELLLGALREAWESRTGSA